MALNRHLGNGIPNSPIVCFNMVSSNLMLIIPYSLKVLDLLSWPY